jgi:kumamolisin
VVSWAEAKGLQIVNTAGNRLILNVRGAAPDIEHAFNVQMSHYQHPSGRVFRSPDRAPSMDLDVAIDSINGLNDLIRPVNRLSKSDATPRTGSGSGGLYIGKDFRAAYAAGVPTTITGSGQGIALFEFSTYYAVDPKNYWSDAGIPTPTVTNVNVAGGTTDTSGQDEVSLDIEIAGSLANGATIYVYMGTDGTTILNQIVTDNHSKSVGVSWGWATDSMTTQTSVDPTQDAVFQQMDAQGIACFVAAGDSGTWTTSQWAQSTSSSSFNPINPADIPYVTSVGGSNLSTSSAGGPWSGETVWSDGGGGYSHRYAMPSYQTSGITWGSVTGASTTQRNCPDVAAIASNVYLDSGNGSKAQNVGGTSCAAPLWAAFTALANQTAVSGGKATLGNFNPLLYGVGTGSSYATSIHDITSGTDGIKAGTGFDMATGWGTPVGQTTINALLGSTTQTVSVAVSPTTATLSTGATQQFTATVTGSTNTTVTWTATGGTVSTSGLYTAPATAGTYTVTATSAADTTKKATATVTVTAAGTVSVAISPTTATLATGATQQFTATVTGSTNTSVTWTATGGTVSSTGLYTAPATAGSYTVKATSAADTTKSASAAVTITSTAAQQLVKNPGFESGSTGWTATSGVIGANGTQEPAHAGTYDAWLCGYGSTHTDYVYQSVAIPSTITKATLTYWLHIDTAETSTTAANDTFKAQVRNSSGTVLATLSTVSNLNKATGYVQYTFDLSAYKGQTVRLYFTGTENSSKQTSLPGLQRKKLWLGVWF